MWICEICKKHNYQWDKHCDVCGYYRNHKPFQSVWRKGYESKPGDTNPYTGRREHFTYLGGVTFSRAFAKMWEQGREYRKQEKAYQERMVAQLSGE